MGCHCLLLELPVMSQGTNEYLQPCDITLPQFEVVYSGNIFEDPEGFENQMKSTPSLFNGEGTGTPLQYSCLENPMDGGAWKAAVHGVAEGRT